MLERGARILPVVESGKLVGLLTERDLAKAFLDVRENIDPVYMDNVVRRIVVDDIMVESPTRLRGFVSVIEARDMFIDSGLPALPVVDQEDKVIGVLMRRSLLRLI
ncbi:MAG: CBS domain-containing protein [Candidatus Korarchaeota archaeon]|nr:CBS domain-containing protein [Candidatus Korarchaeota archaeon]